ncbi:MAG: T9SS type A sorting domain-containing protein [Saprospirales bacterium]|nr:T9SS type A sorting domain-containing protein [Saprospirales bacterium]
MILLSALPKRVESWSISTPTAANLTKPLLPEQLRVHPMPGQWSTNGIVFDECTFNNMTKNGIVTWDAIFNVRERNKFSGSPIGILASGSAPLSGWITVGVLGQEGADRNLFENNVVGIRATSNSKVRIFSNDFDNSNFDIAINGTTQSLITDNLFNNSAAGNQFENTGSNFNQNLCNVYTDNFVGTDIVGSNTGFQFLQEDFTTLLHDLFLEGVSSNPGQIQTFQGSNGAARWNYFSAGKPENIKTSTISPYNNTLSFWYFHPNPVIDARLKPLCPLNDICTPHSNFNNWFTSGTGPGCIFPEPPDTPPCPTEPCLEAIRLEITQKTAEYTQYPSDTLLAQLQVLITEREWITDELIWGYMASGDWTSVETLLNEDLNPANRRRLVGAKLAQKQYAGATAILQSFPQVTADDAYFAHVQTINTARLSDTAFVLSGEQEVALLAIAEAPSPEAGYAQALLGLLTDRTFMPRLPDLIYERSIDVQKQFNPPVMEVSPNPVSDLLQVRIPPSNGPRTLELRSLTTGALVQSLQASEQELFTIPVQNLPSGLYLLVLREQGAVVEHCKIIVQH